MIVTCPESGRLRAWLDGEAGGDGAPLAEHVAGCPSCRASVGDLARDVAVVDEALDLLGTPAVDAAATERALARFYQTAARGAPERVPVAAGADGIASGGDTVTSGGLANDRDRSGRSIALADGVPAVDSPLAVDSPTATGAGSESAALRSVPGAADPGQHSVRQLGTWRMPVVRRLRRWRLAAGGLAAALALTLVVATPQGQAAASGFLAQFRTQRFAVVTIDPASTDRVGLQRLERLGTLTRTGPARGSQGQEVQTVDEASRRVGYPVRQADPASLPTGVSRTPKIIVSPAGETRFTFDREKAAAYFRDLGRTDLRLPDRLHGTTLVVATPPMVMLQYSAADGKPALTIGQASDVQVAVEGTASLDEVRDYLLKLPGFPADVAQQLQAIRDWRNTLPIPVPVDKIAWRETTIAGGQGLILTDNTGLGSAAIWRQPDGRIVGVAGPLKGPELQNVVDHLR